MSLTTHKTKPAVCPKCFTKLGAASSPLQEQAPKPGDYTVCGICETILQFTNARDLRIADLKSIAPMMRKQLDYLVLTLRQAKAMLPRRA